MAKTNRCENWSRELSLPCQGDDGEKQTLVKSAECSDRKQYMKPND